MLYLIEILCLVAWFFIGCYHTFLVFFHIFVISLIFPQLFFNFKAVSCDEIFHKTRQKIDHISTGIKILVYLFHVTYFMFSHIITPNNDDDLCENNIKIFPSASSNTQTVQFIFSNQYKHKMFVKIRIWPGVGAWWLNH